MICYYVLGILYSLAHGILEATLENDAGGGGGGSGVVVTVQ